MFYPVILIDKGQNTFDVINVEELNKFPFATSIRLKNVRLDIRDYLAKI